MGGVAKNKLLCNNITVLVVVELNVSAILNAKAGVVGDYAALGLY